MIEASAPVRACDVGGWTDTWFGGPGRLVNVAVGPGVGVRIRRGESAGPVVLDVRRYGDRYAVVPGRPRRPRHPLLEAAVDAYPPPGGVEVTIVSDVPPGCGTGTSATVAVALIGALARARAEEMSPDEVARAAHRIEVEVLGRESGVQDQLCAAHGGINYIEVDDYPEATVSALPRLQDLGQVLSVVFCGRAHDSPAVHKTVIEGAAGRRAAFDRLREAALAARDAVRRGDLDSLGAAMVTNTEAQRSLHPGLIGGDARRVIDVAQSCGARGWKVNGAGGDGGSLSLLSPNPAAKAVLDDRVGALDDRYQVLDVSPVPDGLVVRGGL